MTKWAVIVVCIGCGGSSDEDVVTSVGDSASTDSITVDTSIVSDTTTVDTSAVDSVVPPADTMPDVADATDTTAVDAASCAASSCGARTCGPSPCGYPCGACTGTMVCTIAGACSATCPGAVCTDAWGASICYGAKGYRKCPTDGSKVQLCSCGAGDWSACDPGCTSGGCLPCVNGKCKTAYTQCQAEPTCKAYLECALACTDAACQSKCFTDHTSDTSDMMRGCMFGACASECKR